MLLAMPDRTLQDAGDEARSLTADEDPTRRAIGTAMLMRAGAVIPPAPELVPALAMMEAGSAPAAAVDQLREAVDAQTVAPGPAIEQAVRHAAGQAELRGWLVGLVDVVADKGLEPWTADHERAMAALRGLQQTGDDAWFAEHERYRVEPAPDEVRDAGRALYHHEATGCARCHGVRGQGLEGFPPLARSPWLLGDARRAASIVVHGLYGAITMHDGRKFNSAMEPLGDNLDDDEIAAILTYARGSWGNFAAPVSAAQVAEARAAAPRQGGAWEARALLAEYPPRRDGLIPDLPPPARSWLATLVRQFVVYLVPPLAAAAAILLLLSRSSLD
jgi:mono/diheme cytochrome c family protein